jgi:ribonuclease-3
VSKASKFGANSDYNQLIARLGVPVTHDMLQLALTHRSYAYEQGGLPTNERLEFLGDSVLSIVVTETLYHRYPDLPEGQLAKLRAAVVNAMALAEIARTLQIGEFLRLGRGENASGGRDKSSILADTVEALIGAAYLDTDLDTCKAFVLRLVSPLLETASHLGAGLDWKTSLQELASAQELGVPEYVIDESGPDHDKRFTAQVKFGDSMYGYGEGRSKKQAEQGAASTAYEQLRTSVSSAAEG